MAPEVPEVEESPQRSSRKPSEAFSEEETFEQIAARINALKAGPNPAYTDGYVLEVSAERLKAQKELDDAHNTFPVVGMEAVAILDVEG